MEFINKMKKREFIEMTLKTLAALFACLLAFILLEAMIYGITLNGYMTNSRVVSINSDTTTVYCIEREPNKYFVLYGTEDDGTINWSASASDKLRTKEECLAIANVKEIVFHAPNAFDFSITPIHIVIMLVVVLGVGGFFAYKFVRLAKEYKKIETHFNTTGEIELLNY